MTKTKMFWTFCALLFVIGLAGSGESTFAQDRFAIGAQLAVHDLPEFSETHIGYGFRFTYAAYLPFLSFDSEINSFPTSSTGNLGETQVFFGLKAGLRVRRWGVFAKARPGFINFGGGANPQRLTSATDFALDLGGGVEYYFLPHVGLRVDLGDIGTFFGGGQLLAGPGSPIGAPLHTQHSLQSTAGIVLTF